MNKEVYYKYFQENILPKIKPFEEYRIKTVRKLFFYSLFMFLLGIIFAFFYVYISWKYKAAAILLPFMLFLMYVFFIKSIINVIWEGKRYQNWLVENVLPLFYEPVANFKIWSKNTDTEAIINSALFRNFDTQEDVSSIFGVYKNTNILISDTRLTLPVKGAVKQNLFKGTVIQLETDKNIENHIVVMSKNVLKSNKYKQINPKIKDLNKNAYVFTKNNKNLDFISNEFWNIIKPFGELYLAKSFRFSYNGNTVIIALEQKRPWQFGFIFKSLLRKENYDDLIERLIIIYNLIDYILSRQFC